MQSQYTQMWRSSWLGPVGYGGWANTELSFENFVSQNWSIACNYGTGMYNYYPVMYGYASNLGDGPTIRSDNELDGDHCGANPP